MVPVRRDRVQYSLLPAFRSSRQPKKEIATRTEVVNPSGFRPLVFDVFVTRNDPGAGGVVKQGVEERGFLGYPDILVESVRFPPIPSPQNGGRDNGEQRDISQSNVTNMPASLVPFWARETSSD